MKIKQGTYKGNGKIKSQYVYNCVHRVGAVIRKEGEAFCLVCGERMKFIKTL